MPLIPHMKDSGSHIVLVPASLLPFKPHYERLSQTLPQGTALLVLPRAHPKQRQLLVRLSAQLAQGGHPIATRTVEEVVRL